MSLKDFKAGTEYDMQNNEISDVEQWWNKLTGKDIELQNYDLQVQQFEYEKSLQQQMFEREDSAYQRKVADLKAAGINPVMAAGGSGASAGPVVKVNAPQRGMQAKANQLNMMGMMMNALKMKADISRTNAETQLTKATAKRVNEQTRYDVETNPYKTTQQRVKAYVQETTGSTQVSAVRFRRDLLRYQASLTSHQAEKAFKEISLTEKKILTEEARRLGLLKDLDLKKQQQILNAWMIAYKEYDLRMYGEMGLPTTAQPSQGHQYLSTANTALQTLMNDIKQRITGWQQ